MSVTFVFVEKGEGWDGCHLFLYVTTCLCCGEAVRSPEFRLILARGKKKKDSSSTRSFAFIPNKELGDLKDTQQRPCAGMWANIKEKTSHTGNKGTYYAHGEETPADAFAV